MSNIKKAKIVFIGCGAMGGAIAEAVCRTFNPVNIVVTAAHPEHAQSFAEKNGCTAASNSEAVKDADFIFLAVKPVYISSVLAEIGPVVKKDAVIISMAAGISLEKLTFAMKNTNQLIRIMPNMPAAVGEAMTALCCGTQVSAAHIADTKTLLESAGKVEQVDEKLMDCVTAVSGSGPAYVFMFIEALADAAVRHGMPRKQAYTYAAQTVKGAAVSVLNSGKTPAELKDQVCSPGGTTIAAVAALEKYGLRNAVIEGVKACYDKSVEMGK
jgi:pyrroline-5-carboxylate reductase